MTDWGTVTGKPPIDDKPVVISFATVMDGQVLRWYADLAAAERGTELATASRSRASVRDAASPAVRDAAEAVYRLLRDSTRQRIRPDLSPWITHDQSFPSGAITVHGAPAEDDADEVGRDA